MEIYITSQSFLEVLTSKENVIASHEKQRRAYIIIGRSRAHWSPTRIFNMPNTQTMYWASKYFFIPIMTITYYVVGELSAPISDTDTDVLDTTSHRYLEFCIWFSKSTTII